MSFCSEYDELFRWCLDYFWIRPSMFFGTENYYSDLFYKFISFSFLAVWFLEREWKMKKNKYGDLSLIQCILLVFFPTYCLLNSDSLGFKVRVSLVVKWENFAIFECVKVEYDLQFLLLGFRGFHENESILENIENLCICKM